MILAGVAQQQVSLITVGVSNTTPAVIVGVGYTGQTLTATAGTWVGGSPTGRWKADGVDIDGETSLTYVVTSDLDGSSFTYVETVGAIMVSSNAIHHWIPTDSGTLSSWFDPTLASTVTLNGNSITDLDPRAGSAANVLIQATEANRPQYTATLNGLPAMLSDGGATLIWLESGSYTLGSDNIFALVYDRDAGVYIDDQDGVVAVNGSTSDWQFTADSGGTPTTFAGGIRVANMGGTYQTKVSPAPADDSNVYLLKFDFTNSLRKIFVNGSEDSSEVYNDAVDASVALKYMISRGETSGAEGIYGDLIIDNTASVATAEKIEAYLAYKYNKALVGGHTYVSTPPTP